MANEWVAEIRLQGRHFCPQLAHQAADRGRQVLALGGEHDVAWVADEECETHTVLQLFDLLADGCSGLVQLVGGQFEAAPTRRTFKVQQPGE